METAVFRARHGRGLTVATAVACTVVVAVTVAEAGVAGLRWAPALGLPVALVWLLYGRPAVVVDRRAVQVRNVLRTVDVPWARIQGLDTRYALTLHTPAGPVAAWAAPQPGRSQVVRAAAEDLRHLPRTTYVGGRVGPGDIGSSTSGQAAAYIRRELERRAEEPVDGHGSTATGVTDEVTARWEPAPALVVLALAAVAVLAVQTG